MRSLCWLCICTQMFVFGCGDDDKPTDPDAQITQDAGQDASLDAHPPDANNNDASSDDDAGFDPRAVDCFANLTPPNNGFVSIQRFQSMDGSLQLWRARQPGERAGAVGETTPYDLVRVWIDGPRDANTCITTQSALSYDFEHHNWNDTWSATTDNTRYEVNELYTFPDFGLPVWVDTLQLFDADTVALGDAQTLLADGCSSDPWNYGPCALRDRTDMPPASQGE